MIVYRCLFGFVAATVAMVILVGAVGASASEGSGGGDATCRGGSIAN